MKLYLQKHGIKEPVPVQPSSSSSLSIMSGLASQSPLLWEAHAQAEQIFNWLIGRQVRQQACHPAQGLDGLVYEESNSNEAAGVNDKHSNMCAFWSISIFIGGKGYCWSNHPLDCCISAGLAHTVQDGIGLHARPGDVSSMWGYLFPCC